MASAKAPLLGDDDDDTLQFGEEDTGQTDKFKHPYVVFFHLCFRVSALVLYIICNFFQDSFIASFVSVILLLSMDFWTVKNITGRLLVGLRWWNYVDEDGKSNWVFESRKGRLQSRANPSETRIFWLALVLVPFIWAILFIVAVFRFNLSWLLLVCIAIVLNGANLYGYIKCKVGTNEPISSTLSNMSSNFFRKQLITNMTNIMARPQGSTNATPTNII